MLTSVRTPVTVFLHLDPVRRKVQPCFVDWDGKRYRVEKLGLYHWYRRGTRKIHVFSVNVGTLDMRVEVDSETFECLLTEVSDGLAD